MHSQNDKDTGIIIFLDLRLMILLTHNLQLAFIAGRVHCYLILILSLSRILRLPLPKNLNKIN